MPITTDQTVHKNRPDIVMLDKITKEVYLSDAATMYAVQTPTHSRNFKEKSKRYLYGLGKALRFTEVSGSQISKQ